MSLEEAYKLINTLYEKYNKKEEKRNEIVCKLVKKQDKIKSQISKEDININLLKHYIKEENLREIEDKKFIRGFNLRLIIILGLSALSLLFFKSFIIFIIDLLLSLLIMGTYSVSYTVKNGHLPFRKKDQDYIDEIKATLNNKLAKKENLERKNNRVAKEIHVFSHLQVYKDAMEILRNLAIGLNAQNGFENTFNVPLKNREIEWLYDMGRKIKREK